MTLIRSLLLHATARGARLDQLCAAAGLTPEQLNQPDLRVTSQAAGRAWRLAVEQTGDNDFGLHLGEQSPPPVLGLVGYVMLSSVTLQAAFERLVRYSNLLTDGVRGTLHCGPDEAVVELRLVTDLDNFLLTEPRHPMESTVATLVHLAKVLAGRRLPVTRVAFQHVAPARTTEHRRVFGPAVTFNAPLTQLTFASKALAWPVQHAHAGLLAAFEQEAAAWLGRLRADQAWSARVQQAAAAQFRGEVPGMQSVARALQISPRSLQRHLALEKTAFRAQLDVVRRQLALRHLGNPATSITEVALLLGFSEPSAFYRSFRRWTRQTPVKYRASLERPAAPTASGPASPSRLKTAGNRRG